MWPKDNAYAYPRVAEKGTVTSIKLMGEVGIAVQTRVNWNNEVNVTSLWLFTEISLLEK